MYDCQFFIDFNAKSMGTGPTTASQAMSPIPSTYLQSFTSPLIFRLIKFDYIFPCLQYFGKNRLFSFLPARIQPSAIGMTVSRDFSILLYNSIWRNAWHREISGSLSSPKQQYESMADDCSMIYRQFMHSAWCKVTSTGKSFIRPARRIDCYGVLARAWIYSHWRPGDCLISPLVIMQQLSLTVVTWIYSIIHFCRPACKIT